jgi:hypothetical protein
LRKVRPTVTKTAARALELLGLNRGPLRRKCASPASASSTSPIVVWIGRPSATKDRTQVRRPHRSLCRSALFEIIEQTDHGHQNYPAGYYSPVALDPRGAIGEKEMLKTLKRIDGATVHACDSS